MPALPKQELRQLVATACADEALSQLLQLLAGVPKYNKAYNAMNLLSGQWQELDQHLRLNLLSFKEASTDRARINAAVLAYLDELPDEIAPPKSTGPAAEALLRQNIQTIAADTAWEYDLFFSFSSKDLEAARNFCHVLRGHGMRVFFSADDLRNRGGHNFGSLIEKALQRSRNFLLFCSPNAMASEWVELEHDTFFQNYHLPNKHTRGFFIAEGPDFRNDLVPAFYRRSQRIQDPEALLQTFAISAPSPVAQTIENPTSASSKKETPSTLSPKANPADEVSWKIACKNNTVAAYQGYLDKWKNGIHDAEAEQKIEDLANDQDLWDYLKDHSNPEMLEGNLLDYLATFPEGIHAKEARVQIAVFESARAAESAAIKRREEEDLRKREASQNRSEKQKAAHKKRRDDKARLVLEKADLAAEAQRAKEAERLEKERLEKEAAASAAEAQKARDAAKALAATETESLASVGVTQSHPDTAPKNGQVIRDFPDGPEMVFVEGGRFIMGSNEDESSKPVHPVNVPSFWMGKYPVTFDEYDAFCIATGKEKPEDENWGRGRRPVINVSWDDAQEFCKWLFEKTGQHYRLPSEAEWEFAARGGGEIHLAVGEGHGEPGFLFAGSNDLDEVAWFWENSGDHKLTGKWNKDAIRNNNCKTHTVGKKSPNELCLYDMSGNVWEWCEDASHENYHGAPSDASAWIWEGDQTKVVLRGGSWNVISDFCSVTLRNWLTRNYKSSNIGFRVAKDL